MEGNVVEVEREQDKPREGIEELSHAVGFEGCEGDVVVDPVCGEEPPQHGLQQNTARP